MARYSSESDSDHSSRYRRRRNRRSRSSSSDSSDSSSHRKRSSKHYKTKRRHRSRSRSRGRDRDRSQKSYKSSRNSSSKDREKRRYHSSKGRSRYSDRSKRKGRSISREKSGSRSSSSQSTVKATMPEKPQLVAAKDEFPIEPRFKEGVLDEINSEGFAPKQFSSSGTKEKKFKNIVIDITGDTIQIPMVADEPCGLESVFHSSIMLDQEARFDKWVKKLYTLRQKAITDLIQSSVT